MGGEAYPTFDAMRGFSKGRDRRESYGTRNPAEGVSIRTVGNICITHIGVGSQERTRKSSERMKKPQIEGADQKNTQSLHDCQ